MNQLSNPADIPTNNISNIAHFLQCNFKQETANFTFICGEKAQFFAFHPTVKVNQVKDLFLPNENHVTVYVHPLRLQ